MPKVLKRTDSHRPSAINPDEYEYVGQECMKIEGLGDCYVIQQERENIRRHMERTGGTYSKHAHGGNCMVCGSVNAIYTVLFYHQASNSYVRMGQDCAQKCDMGDAAAFRTFRDAITAATQAKAGKLKAQGILDKEGLSRCWEVFAMDGSDGEKLVELGWQTKRIVEDDHYNCDCVATYGWGDRVKLCPKCKGYGTYTGAVRKVPVYDNTKEYNIIIDIVGKLVKYGSISDAQLNFLRKLLNDHDHKGEREARYAAERAAAKNCPTGRLTVEAEVIKTDLRESAYGDTLKMLVKTVDGYMLWGTVPSSLQIFQDGEFQRELRRGDKIKLTATIKPSDNDPKFGFFSRPIGSLIGAA